MLFLLKFSIVEKVEVRNESDRRNCKETAVKNFGRNGDQTNNRQDQRDTVQYDRARLFSEAFFWTCLPEVAELASRH